MLTEDFHVYAPVDGHGLKHDPFNAIVGPRPIGWISSVDVEGHVNLAPYSFFNAFNYTPPIVGFSSIVWKDTVANIAQTKSFVWNLTTQDLARQMNISSASVPHGLNEFDLARLASLPSRVVNAPRVAASPVQFECRLTQMLQLQTAEGSDVDTWMIFGEVVMVHIRRDLVADGVYDTVGAQPVLRAGGAGDYATIGRDTMFEMLRPKDDADIARQVAALYCRY